MTPEQLGLKFRDDPRHRKQDETVFAEVVLGDCYGLRSIADRLRDARLIVDVGAHVGCFTAWAYYLAENTFCEFVCVEACPENQELLRSNVFPYAEVIRAACTYDVGPMLLNSVFEGGTATGGSIVVSGAPGSYDRELYRLDTRPLPTVTLEEVCRGDPVDVLKLDCEGSEFSILEHADMSRVKYVVGEYHGRVKFLELVRRKYADWKFEDPTGGEIGQFRLTNPRF